MTVFTDGWLFYRADVEAVVGKGSLKPELLCKNGWMRVSPLGLLRRPVFMPCEAWIETMLVLLLTKRQSHFSPAIAAIDEFRTAAVKVHGGFHEAQANAGTFSPGDLIFEGVKSIENSSFGVFWNAGSLVENAQLNAFFLLRKDDFDFSSFG